MPSAPARQGSKAPVSSQIPHLWAPAPSAEAPPQQHTECLGSRAWLMGRFLYRKPGFGPRSLWMTGTEAQNRTSEPEQSRPSHLTAPIPSGILSPELSSCLCPGPFFAPAALNLAAVRRRSLLSSKQERAAVGRGVRGQTRPSVPPGPPGHRCPTRDSAGTSLHPHGGHADRSPPVSAPWFLGKDKLFGLWTRLFLNGTGLSSLDGK